MLTRSAIGNDARGAIHSTKIQTSPTRKRGPPQKVDQFFRNFSGWTEPIHWVLDRNFRKFWLNGLRPSTYQSSDNHANHYYLQRRNRSLHHRFFFLNWFNLNVSRKGKKIFFVGFCVDHRGENNCSSPTVYNRPCHGFRRHLDK